MPKHRLRAAMLIVIGVVAMACEEGQVQQTDPEQQGSGVSGAPRSEKVSAVRYAEATALVEAGNADALDQTKQSAACATREGKSPDRSARIGDFIPPDSVRDYEIFDLAGIRNVLAEKAPGSPSFWWIRGRIAKRTTPSSRGS